MIGVKFHSPDNRRSLVSVMAKDRKVMSVTVRLAPEILSMSFDFKQLPQNFFEGMLLVDKTEESIWYLPDIFLSSLHPSFLGFTISDSIVIRNPYKYFKMWRMDNGFEERVCTRIFP